MNRVCHICETVVGAKDVCPVCTEMVKTLPDPHTMSAEARIAEMRMWEGVLEIEFHLMHTRIEQLVGRDVWITEFLSYDSLVAEAGENTGEHLLSRDEVISRMMDNQPQSVKDKMIIVEEQEDGSLSATSFDEWDTDLPAAFEDSL